MTIEKLIEAGSWTKYFLNEKKEKLPYTQENNELFLNFKLTPKWSLVYEKI